MGRAYFGEQCRTDIAVLPRADDKVLMQQGQSSKYEKLTAKESKRAAKKERAASNDYAIYAPPHK